MATFPTTANPVAARIASLNDTLTAVQRTRESGVTAAESESLADVERQGLVMVGFLRDIEAGRAGMNGVEAQLLFQQVERFCAAVREGLEAAGVAS